MRAPEFVSLAELLLRPDVPPAVAACEPREAGAGQVRHRAPLDEGPAFEATSAASPPRDPHVVVAGDERAAVRDARLFRARLADAFDDAFGRLLRELATEVLARELRIAPCDLVALIERIGRDAPFVRVRVAPADAAHEYGVPSIVDPMLEPGDAVLELAGGARDLRLGVRLAGVLEKLT